MSFFNGLNKRPQPQLQPRAKFPPVVSFIDFVGEVREEDTFRYPRNIGCSSTLGGIPLFLFGDTFEQRSNSQFLGIASSTASLGSHANPFFTRYSSYSPTNKDDSESYATQFIPFSEVEDEYNQSVGRDLNNSSNRYYLWTFNAVIEIPGKPDHGVIWFVKGKTNGSREANNRYYGVGVAEVEMKQVAVVGAEFAEEMPVAKRRGDVIFDELSPQWGNVATLLDGDFIYLYGTHNQQNCRRHMRRKAGNNFVGFVENPVFVCRVPHADKSYLFPERYTYWDGEAFSAAPPTSESKGKRPHLEPVLFNILTGTVFRTTLFSSTKEGLFIMIGCDGSGDGKVRFKIAENPWGPWRGEGWILDLETEDRGYTGVKSCVYAHLWASDLERGELVLSWSEPWPGGVEMVKIGFEMVGDGGEEEEIEQNVGDDADSMFSDVEEHLMRTIGGQPPREEQDMEFSYAENPEDEERNTARRRALAKLTGDIGSVDFQGYLDAYRMYHDPFDSGCDMQSSSFQMWGRNPFGNKVSDDTLLRRKVSGDWFTGSPRTKHEPEGISQTEEVLPIGRGMRRLAGLSQGSWCAKPREEVKSEETWYTRDSYGDAEQGEGSRVTIPDDVETHFHTRWIREKDPVQELNRNRNKESSWEDTESGDEEPIPLAIVEPRRRLKWGTGLKVDVSSASKRNVKALPGVVQTPVIISSCGPALTSTGAPHRQQHQTLQQETQYRLDHQRTSNRRTSNRNARPLATAVDERGKTKFLVSRERVGYTGDEGVGEIRGTHSQPLRAIEALVETRNETKKQSIESQQPETKKSGQWLKAVKKGMQKLMQKNCKQASENESKPDKGLCRRLKKKFSEISLLKVGKNHTKPRNCEVDLEKYVKEKKEEALRRFVEAQFDAGN